MPIEFEDASGTDITGDPTPASTRTADQIRQDMQRTVKARSQGPQVPEGGGGQKPSPGGQETPEGDPIGDALGGAWNALTSHFSNLHQGPPDTAGMNIFQRMQTDGYYGYQMGRKLWQDLAAFQGDAVHLATTSTRNAWDMNPALAYTASQMLTTMPMTTLGAPLGLLGPERIRQTLLSQDQGGMAIPGLTGLTGDRLHPERAGQLLGQTTPQQEKKIDVGGAQEAAKTYTDPQTYLTAVAPESRLAMGATGAYGFANQLFSQGQLTPQSIIWAAIAGMVMSNAPLPAPVSQAVKRVIPNWGEIEGRLFARMAGNIQKQQKLASPDGYTEFWNDLVKNVAKNEQVKSSQKTLVKGVKPGEKTVTATVDEKGNVILSDKAQQKRMKRLYQKYGVESASELMDKLEYGGLSSDQVASIQKDWKKLNIPHDLVAIGEGESPLIDPATHQGDIKQAMAQKFDDAMTALHMFVDQAHRGPFGNTEDPFTSLWRSLIGYHRTTDLIHQHLIASWVRLLGDDAGKLSVQQNLTRAVEGDQKVYQSLSPEQKAVADSWRITVASLRRLGKAQGYSEDFIANWFPRVRSVPKEVVEARQKAGAGGVSSTGILQGERRRHRASMTHLGEVEDEEGNVRQAILQMPRYETVFDANKALAQDREQWVDRALDPKHQSSDPRIRQIRETYGTQGENAARQLAQEMASGEIRDFETNFLSAANRTLGRQLGAIHSHMAVQHLLDTVWQDAQGRLHPAAVNVTQDKLAGMGLQELSEMGYRTPASPWFNKISVNPEMASLLEKGSRLSQTWLTREGFTRALLRLEADAVKGIMYSPMIHGINMAGRLGAYWLSHPLAVTKHITRGGPGKTLERLKGVINPSNYGVDDEDFFLRLEAARDGAMPFTNRPNWASEVLGASADALGESGIGEYPHLMEDTAPAWARRAGLSTVYGMGKKVGSGYNQLNNILWRNVSDFGVMVHHIEKEALLKTGKFDAYSAGHLAGRRANSWMGHVAPEDANPNLHNMARLVTFAPNWWRTWGELLTGYYRNTGFNWTGSRIRAAAKNDLKTMIAFYAFQKMSGNVFNFMASGHPQWDNQPGNQDHVEITRPEIIRFLQDFGIGKDIDPTTGANPRNGARLTIENPLARQTYSTEKAVGYQSGQPGQKMLKMGPLEIDSPPSWDAAWKGAKDFAAARVSPVVNWAAAMGNVDLYRSIADNQIRHVNPTHDAPGLDNLFLSLADLTPLGNSMLQAGQQQANQEIRQGASTTVDGPWGTKIPRSVQDSFTNLPQTGLSQLLSGLTGVNPAYEYAARSPGQSLSDQQYQQIDQLNQQYDQQMQQLQAMLATGQITPQQWHNSYVGLSTQRGNALTAYFQGAPSYTQGTMGLVNQYENIYNDPAVKNPDGTINSDAVAAKQDEFRAGLSQAEQAAMDAQLTKNQQKYPVLKMWKDAQTNYYNFQQTWAASQGINPFTLQQEAYQLGQLYSDRRAYTMYLAEHPELTAWENAKKQWMYSPDGMIYGLFVGSSTAVSAAQNQGVDLFALQQQGHPQQALSQQQLTQAAQQFLGNMP